MRPVPILFLGDGADRYGGLSRITRHLASQLSASPRYRVATLGRGAVGSRKLPFAQYTIRDLGETWGMYDLPRVWEDFAGTERGVVMTIWDASRTLWLSRPEFCPDESIAEWLGPEPFDFWGAFPLLAPRPRGPPRPPPPA